MTQEILLEKCNIEAVTRNSINKLPVLGVHFLPYKVDATTAIERCNLWHCWTLLPLNRLQLPLVCSCIFFPPQNFVDSIVFFQLPWLSIVYSFHQLNPNIVLNAGKKSQSSKSKNNAVIGHFVYGFHFHTSFSRIEMILFRCLLPGQPK